MIFIFAQLSKADISVRRLPSCKYFIFVSGKPDAPTDLTQTGVSWNTVMISWLPGFDGGKTQSFIVLVDGAVHPMTEVRQKSAIISGTKRCLSASYLNIHGYLLATQGE